MKLLRVLRPSHHLSPHGLTLLALFWTLVFLLLHLAGAREYTSVFSGTVPRGALGPMAGLIVGGVYALFYLGSVVLVPILVIAAALLLLGMGLISRHRA